MAALLLVFIGCNYSKPSNRELLDQYTDSFIKYMNIETECGIRLMHYYKLKGDSAYHALYPNGNLPVIKATDSICYEPKY